MLGELRQKSREKILIDLLANAVAGVYLLIRDGGKKRACPGADIFA
jgi:hypothetical protein